MGRRGRWEREAPPSVLLPAGARAARRRWRCAPAWPLDRSSSAPPPFPGCMPSDHGHRPRSMAPVAPPSAAVACQQQQITDACLFARLNMFGAARDSSVRIILRAFCNAADRVLWREEGVLRGLWIFLGEGPPGRGGLLGLPAEPSAPGPAHGRSARRDFWAEGTFRGSAGAERETAKSKRAQTLCARPGRSNSGAEGPLYKVKRGSRVREGRRRGLSSEHSSSALFS